MGASTTPAVAFGTAAAHVPQATVDASRHLALMAPVTTTTTSPTITSGEGKIATCESLCH